MSADLICAIALLATLPESCHQLQLVHIITIKLILLFGRHGSDGRVLASLKAIVNGLWR